MTIRAGFAAIGRDDSPPGPAAVSNALTGAEQTAAQAAGLDPTVVYPVTGVETQVVLPVTPGCSVTLGLRYESGTGLEDSAGRFRVLSLDGSTVLGGSTFVVRRR